MDKTKFSVEKNDGEVHFHKGILESYSYSYQIDSWGSIELSEDETYKLYQSMKNYYEKDSV